MIEIVVSIIKDIKKDYKIFIKYLIGIMLLSVLSKVSSVYLIKINSSDQTKSILITLFSFIIISIQYFIYMSFFSSYVKLMKVDYEFTNRMKGYFHTIRIFILQNLIALGLFIAVIALESILKADLIGSFGVIIIIVCGMLWVIWNIRMFFVTQIIFFKRDKYKMKEIVKESVKVLRDNIRLIILTFLIQLLFIVLLVFVIIKGIYNSNISSIVSILSLAVNLCATLVYTKIFIEYSKKKYGVKSELTPASTL